MSSALPGLLLALGTAPDLPVYGAAPAFALIDQHGKAVRSEDLAGRVWIADFMFTSCHDECPMQTRALGRLQRKIGSIPKVRFMSFSVDPEQDSPARLFAYAKEQGVDQRGWSFLTGDPDALKAVARGLKVHTGFRQHGRSFVLVDGQRRIRGYYRQDTGSLRDLERGVRRLAGIAGSVVAK